MYRALPCCCTGEEACTGLFFVVIVQVRERVQVIVQVREHVPGSSLLLYR